MINAREKMVFAAGTWECRAQFAITKRAAKRDDAADNPEHEQREAGLNICNWNPRLVNTPVPMMLAMTIPQAVRNPIVRGGAVLREISSVLGATVRIDDGIVELVWPTLA